MSVSLHTARNAEELVEAAADGDPYVYAHIFPQAGWRRKARARKKLRLLRRIDRGLQDMLRDGERVFFVTQGVASLSLIEWFLFGWAMYYLNRRAIVLTNHRVLLLQINSRFRLRELRAQIEYAAVARVRSTFSGYTRIEFHDGDRLLLAGVPRRDRRHLMDVMGRLTEALDSADALGGVDNLCPHCYERVAMEPPRCPACDGRFKSVRKAALLSLILPGAGDFYLGHRGFAALETAGAVLIWLGVLSLALDPTVGAGVLVITLISLVVVSHGLDALATRHIAHKGLYPDSGRRERWRFVAAAAIPVVVLAVVATQLPAKAALRPLPFAVPGDQVPPEHLEAIRNAGLIEPGEPVLYFFSGGPESVLQHGSLFTDGRIVSYERNFDSVFYTSAWYEEVVDLHEEYSLMPGQRSAILAVKDDGGVLFVVVSTVDGGDRAFAERLRERWRAVRSETRDGGVWYDGGAGGSFDDAVLIRGTGPERPMADAERAWLVLWFGEEDVDWQLVDRTRHTARARPYDEVTVSFPSGETMSFFFGIGGE